MKDSHATRGIMLTKDVLGTRGKVLLMPLPFFLLIV